ncbi:MAG: ECF transporter S component [Bacillota bacterium]
MAQNAQPRVVKSGIGTMAWLLVPVAVGINLVGNFIAVSLKLPVFLDSIGTVTAAILAGPWIGALVGLLTNLIAGLLITPTWLWYAVVNVVFGIVAGFLARKGWYSTIPRTIVCGLILAVIGMIVSAPITAYVYGGVTGAGEDFIRAYLYATGKTLLEGAITASAITEPLDKIISAIIAFLIVKGVPHRYRAQFK